MDYGNSRSESICSPRSMGKKHHKQQKPFQNRNSKVERLTENKIQRQGEKLGFMYRIKYRKMFIIFKIGRKKSLLIENANIL